jgi:hypothetical protein
MLRKTKTTEQMAFAGWNPWTSDDNGHWTHDQINTATTVQCAIELRLIRQTLQAIRNDILALGTDGLHEVIRTHRTKLRREEKARRTRSKREREARRRADTGRPE